MWALTAERGKERALSISKLRNKRGSRLKDPDQNLLRTKKTAKFVSCIVDTSPWVPPPHIGHKLR